MQSTTATRNHYLEQQRIQRKVLRDIRRIWARMGGEWSSSFARISPDLVGAVSEAQVKMAAATTAFMHDFLDEVDLQDRPVAEVVSTSLAGYSSDGYPLDSLLYGGVVAARQAATTESLTAPQSLRAGLGWLAPVVSSQIADVGRSVTGMSTATRSNLSGYTRFLNPPSCQRCAVLAGRVYRYSTGFQRHPRCFPAGVVTSGPALEAASRRWFEGELVVLTTASGQELPLTGNHPVLTSRGWVAANLIREGDEVVRSTRPEGAFSLKVPDHHEVPSRIEDVWGAYAVSGLDSVESSPEDFHGDGQQGKVDIVRADGSLNDRCFAAGLQHAVEGDFAVAPWSAPPFVGQRPSQVLDLGYAAHAGDLVGREGLGFALGFGQSLVAGLAGLAHPSSLYTGAAQDGADGSARDFVLPGQGVFAGSGFVGEHNLAGGNVHASTRWDAPTLPDPVEQGRGYTEVGLDLLDRLAGQVELDRVVFSRSVSFAGHVYSLASSEGWHSANSLIVSNCDCLMVPAESEGWAKSEGFVLDPTEDLSLVKDLSKAQRAAIDAGADFSQVVNSTRGMKMVGEGDRRRQITLSGTSRRGVYGRAEIERTGQIVRDTGRRQGAIESYRLSRAATPRLTPNQIMRQARNRDEVVDYLRKYRYIT
jgi:hypothetical protein